MWKHLTSGNKISESQIEDILFIDSLYRFIASNARVKRFCSAGDDRKCVLNDLVNPFDLVLDSNGHVPVQIHNLGEYFRALALGFDKPFEFGFLIRPP